jgi:hypothetical protein
MTADETRAFPLTEHAESGMMFSFRVAGRE